MLGDFDAAVAAARAELSQLLSPPVGGALAVDLGAGPGVYALPLADAGFQVLAVDACALLLDELTARAGTRTIVRVQGELTAFRPHIAQPADAILCMGDTLTHLQSQAVVEALMADIAAALTPGGVFLATFRDYSGQPPQGAARFIPVRSDADRILTCFLEYEPQTVLVHDLLHTRVDGAWKQSVSAYRKLRISPAWLVEVLARVGLHARVQPGPRGMVQVLAQRG
jgi:SAM-dependent methyltransferase